MLPLQVRPAGSGGAGGTRMSLTAALKFNAKAQRRGAARGADLTLPMLASTVRVAASGSLTILPHLCGFAPLR